MSKDLLDKAKSIEEEEGMCGGAPKDTASQVAVDEVLSRARIVPNPRAVARLTKLADRVVGLAEEKFGFYPPEESGLTTREEFTTIVGTAAAGWAVNKHPALNSDSLNEDDDKTTLLSMAVLFIGVNLIVKAYRHFSAPKAEPVSVPSSNQIQ